MILKEFFYTKGYSHFIHSVASDHVLDVLTNSMWSTMMITGIFFMSILFLFLSFKVGHSIRVESGETGPAEISFLFSISGIRYIGNHVRHHLFETPLLPRRRFSSLSISWFSEIIKRTSFSSRSRDIFSVEDTTYFPEKTRRNSASSESHGSRRHSVTSKSKRLSVPHISTNSNRNSAPTTTHSTPKTFSDKNNSSLQVISRRNTLPNISINPEYSRIRSADKIEIHKHTDAQQARIDFLEISTISSNLNTIIEEEPTESDEKNNAESLFINENSPLSKSNYESDGMVSNLETCESIFGDIITDESDAGSILEEQEVEEDKVDEKIEEINTLSEPVNILQKPSNQVKVDQFFEQSSPKPTSFRSSYLNYLPESIFGYSTGLSKNFSSSSSIAPTGDSGSAPPGFTKRSTSHDFTNTTTASYTGSSNDNFSSHQPLYARRRTESSHLFSDTTKSFFPFDFTSKFQAISSPNPNRTNTSSPCLSDLQNTEDLFAPINWNFSNEDQTDSLRKSWNSIEEVDQVKYFSGNSYEIDSNSESKRRQAASFSSLFH